EKLNKLLFSSISLIFFPAIFLAVLVFIISDNVSYFLFENYDYTVQVKIVSAAIPFIVLNTLLEGYLRGLKIIKVYVKVVIFSNIINIVIVISLLLAFGLNGALVGILSANVSYIIISLYYLRKNQLVMLNEFRFYFDRELFRKIVKVSFVFLASGALFQFTLILMRKIIIAKYGIYYNGIFQSVIGISLNYFAFIFLALSTYSFPTVSKIESKSELIDELNINVKYIIHILVPLIILVFTFRRIVLTVLFSKDFMSAENFFQYQFFGDYFKALAWAIGIWLVPKMKLRIFLLLEVILNLNLV
ncbi:MAG: oligosaccharide flippase family protein, partial [Ignavibacteria bacterium]